MIEVDPKNIGLIRIERDPVCELPKQMKSRLVGLELPCVYRDLKAKSFNLMTGQPVAEHHAYIVLRSHALAVFDKTAPKLARYVRGAPVPAGD